MISKKTLWILWVVVTASLSSYYAYGLVGKDKSMFIPGATTSGHYQIELACEACHTDPFGGKEVLQESCMECHGKELKLVDDSHPKSKFTDPRNADRIAILDARYCVTCHVEHVEDRTHTMGVTLPDDFCAYCHQDIEEDRPSHKDMAFDTCAAAGCHNFHDNKALYEDFLVKHGKGEKLTATPLVISRTFAEHYRQQKKNISPLTIKDARYPASKEVDELILAQWEQTAHARIAVNCVDCHQVKTAINIAGTWQDKPSIEACQECHELEMETYQLGKHGMRLAQDMTPLDVSTARQPMKKDIKDSQHDCMSCHGSHDFNTRKAAVDACLTCHEDEHSSAYKSSPHYKLWQEATAGKIADEAGVSCATCHLPRLSIKHKGEERTLVQHNQNHNLRPNEKMIRDACLSCHGLGFSIDALADSKLIANNFNGLPRQNIPSIAMAMKREKEKAAEKRNKSRKKSKSDE
ncbi:cytochrome c3 family protein [Kaarinaea lacus]